MVLNYFNRPARLAGVERMKTYIEHTELPPKIEGKDWSIFYHCVTRSGLLFTCRYDYDVRRWVDTNGYVGRDVSVWIEYKTPLLCP